jgi:Family of unknown function (DUF5924)/Protein of unknown function (DUF2914)
MKLFEAIRRHERLLWWLHSLYALAAGIAVMWVGARHFGFLRLIFIQIAFIWATSLLLPWVGHHARLTPRLRWWIRAAINYLNKDFYQQLLFFVLPVYYASATLRSPNVIFLGILAGSAVLSTFDVVYNRHVAARPTLLAVFFAFNLFACLNVALPVLWSIGNGTAMWCSALLAVIGFTTLRFRPAEWRRPRVLAVVALSSLVIGATVTWGRALIPPAPLRLAQATIGETLERRPLGIAKPLTALPTDWSGRLYAITAISAPLGLKDRVRQCWYRNDRLVYASPYYDIVGGRQEGYRLWTTATLPQGSTGPLRIDVQTEGGQLIGRAVLETGPITAARSTREPAPRPDADPGRHAHRELVGDRELTGNDRPGARQPSEAGEVPDEGEYADEHRELECVGAARVRQHLPQQPEHRLGDRHRPDGAVEVAALVSFTLRGRLDTRQSTEGAERPNGPREREISQVVDLPQVPTAGDDRHQQPGDVQRRESNCFTPRKRVADTAVKRVRLVLREPDDVRAGLHAGQAAAQARDAGGGHHGAEPQRHPVIEAVLEQIERQGTGRDEEDKDPDGPVIEPVVQLVALPDLPL